MQLIEFHGEIFTAIHTCLLYFEWLEITYFARRSRSFGILPDFLVQSSQVPSAGVFQQSPSPGNRMRPSQRCSLKWRI